MRRLTAVALLSVACASPGIPPGGPPDAEAPQIVRIIPDTGSVNVKPKEVLFQFDEVVGERPPSTTSLSDLFLISPRDGVPSASWHRDAVGVRPTHGWRANTAYTVIMQKGLADIRGNVRNTGASTTFSTGPTIPRTRIMGNIFDWISGAVASGALIEAFVPPDSLHPYVALADSSGAFVLEHLPPGHYIVRGYVDRTRNLGIEPSEPWDSASVNLTDSARTDLLIFVHDTVPPRIREVRARDSLTLQVSFDKPFDPAQTLTAANFAVIGPDSVPVPIVSAGLPPKDTAIAGSPAPAAPLPTAPRRPPTRPDTTVAVKPVMKRPSPTSEAVITLRRPLSPKTTYRVRAIGIRGLLGHVGNSERTFTPPAPQPAATAKPPVAPAAKPPVALPVTPPPIKR